MRQIATILLMLSFSTTALTQDVWEVPEEAQLVQASIDLNDDDAIMAGEKLFGAACWTCHGEYGDGEGIAAEEMDPPPTNLTSSTVQAQTEGTLFYKISYGRDQMANYEFSLSEEERWQLVAFIRSLATEEAQ